MLSKDMEAALNEQVNAELYSAYLYLSMAAYFDTHNLPGFANWMRIQFQEEQLHGFKIMTHITERGGRVWLKAIEGPATEWDSPQAVFAATLEHEQHVTSLINKLVDLSIKESDHASNTFLQWFVNEQVEEEATADEILQQLKMVGDSGHALYMMDKELGGRTLASSADSGA